MSEFNWLKSITRKRPEVAQLVYAMLSAGIRNGRTSAEDAHHIPVTTPKAFGAAVKYLRSCGFVKGAEFCGTTKASKGHSLHHWMLQDYSKAKGVLDKLAKDLCDLPVRGQMNLL